MRWLCALPYAILAGLQVIVTVGGLSDYRSVAPLQRALAPLTPVEQVLSFALIGSFFAAMGIKLGLSQSPDAKRRLRFLYWGAITAFTPSIVVSLYARFQGKSPNEIFPAWLIAIKYQQTRANRVLPCGGGRDPAWRSSAAARAKLARSGWTSML